MKYKLLRDLPGIKAGEILKGYDKRTYEDDHEDGMDICLIYKEVGSDYAKNYPDRFDEVKEPTREIKYPDDLTEGYEIGAGGNPEFELEPYKIGDNGDYARSMYILGNRFPTKESAEAYINLKQHVALFDIVLGIYKHYDIDINIRKEKAVGGSHESIFGKLNKNFMMPLDSSEEELETREKLLRAYYSF